jgi:hypothetical protein
MLRKEEVEGIGAALNESILLGIELDERRRIASIWLEVLSLPDDASPPLSETRLQLQLAPVGRVAASLRMGNWSDDSAPVLPMTVEELPELTAKMRSEMYGWEFIDLPEENFTRWSNRLSLDRDYGSSGKGHSITLFQEYGPHQFIGHFDIRIWFDEITIRDASGGEISVEDFIIDGRHWWDAFNAGDPRSKAIGSGRSMIPLVIRTRRTSPRHSD